MTFHLTTKEAWEQQRTLPFYQPEAFAREGFIHCTDGEHNMVDTANRYYIPRTYIPTSTVPSTPTPSWRSGP